VLAWKRGKKTRIRKKEGGVLSDVICLPKEGGKKGGRKGEGKGNSLCRKKGLGLRGRPGGKGGRRNFRMGKKRKGPPTPVKRNKKRARLVSGE